MKLENNSGKTRMTKRALGFVQVNRETPTICVFSLSHVTVASLFLDALKRSIQLHQPRF